MPSRSVKMKRFIFGFQRVGLMAEVHAGLEQVTHGYDCQGMAPFSVCLALQPAGRGRNLAQS